MRFRLRNKVLAVGAATAVTLLAACNSARHVEEGHYLLDRVEVEVADSDRKSTRLNSSH